jgi:2'-5' RNA ligase
MRLFVALTIPQEAVAYINGVQKALKREIRADRWQPLHNLHLTLHFLGEVNERLLPAIRQDMDIVSAIIPPFTLQLGRLGVFPREERPRILWMGLTGNRKALEQLHLLLGKRFELHPELPYDKRAYRPHVTLARGPQTTNTPLPLLEWNRRFLAEEPPRWQVDAVHLYHSQLHPDGAVHTVIHSSRLSANGSA